MKNHMVSFILAGCWFVSAMVAGQEASKMDRFIDELMSRMTLQEKIGQLNLPVSGNIVTGEAKSSDIAAKIARGEIGELFNLKRIEIGRAHVLFRSVVTNQHPANMKLTI